MTDLPGRIGRAGDGEHAGCFVEIERDPSDAGGHIWLVRDDPRLRRPSSDAVGGLSAPLGGSGSKAISLAAGGASVVFDWIMFATGGD